MARTVDKGHGRLERRRLETTSILTAAGKWPGLAQGFRITRTRTEGGRTSVEVQYGITSLKEQAADAARLLELVREHWGIENGLHWVRDVTLGEDRCRVRKGSAPQVLAALRNVAVHLLSGPDFAAEGLSRAGAMRRLAARLPDAMQLLGLPPLE